MARAKKPKAAETAVTRRRTRATSNQPGGSPLASGIVEATRRRPTRLTRATKTASRQVEEEQEEQEEPEVEADVTAEESAQEEVAPLSSTQDDGGAGKAISSVSFVSPPSNYWDRVLQESTPDWATGRSSRITWTSSATLPAPSAPSRKPRLEKSKVSEVYMKPMSYKIKPMPRIGSFNDVLPDCWFQEHIPHLRKNDWIARDATIMDVIYELATRDMRNMLYRGLTKHLVNVDGVAEDYSHAEEMRISSLTGYRDIDEIPQEVIKEAHWRVIVERRENEGRHRHFDSFRTWMTRTPEGVRIQKAQEAAQRKADEEIAAAKAQAAQELAQAQARIEEAETRRAEAEAQAQAEVERRQQVEQAEAQRRSQEVEDVQARERAAQQSGINTEGRTNGALTPPRTAAVAVPDSSHLAQEPTMSDNTHENTSPHAPHTPQIADTNLPASQSSPSIIGSIGKLLTNITGFGYGASRTQPRKWRTASERARLQAQKRAKQVPQTEHRPTYAEIEEPPSPESALADSPLRNRGAARHSPMDTEADTQIKSAASARQTQRINGAAQSRGVKRTITAASVEAARKRRLLSMPGSWSEMTYDEHGARYIGGRRIVTFGNFDNRDPEERLPQIPPKCFTGIYQLENQAYPGEGSRRRQLALTINSCFELPPEHRLAEFVWQWGDSLENVDTDISPWMRWVTEDTGTWKAWVPGFEDFEQFKPEPRERLLRELNAGRMEKRRITIDDDTFERWAARRCASAPKSPPKRSGTFAAPSDDEEPKKSKPGVYQFSYDSDSDEDTTMYESQEADVPSKPPPRPTPAHASLPPPPVASEEITAAKAPQTPGPNNAGKAALDRARATAQKFKPTTSSRLARVSPEAASPEERTQAERALQAKQAPHVGGVAESTTIFSVPQVGLNKLTEGGPVQPPEHSVLSNGMAHEDLDDGLTREEMDDVDAEVDAVEITEYVNYYRPSADEIARSQSAFNDGLTQEEAEEVDAEVDGWWAENGEEMRAEWRTQLGLVN